MEPIFNPRLLDKIKSFIQRTSLNIHTALVTLTFFQKTVIALLLINLIVTQATLQASQEAADEAGDASSNAESASNSASEAEEACSSLKHY